MPTASEQINQLHGIDTLLKFEDVGGMAVGLVDTPVCKGEFYLHGAHVTGFQPADHSPLLFVSTEAEFRNGKAIRGGVPICFPWFGPHPTDADAPSHGLARTKPWEVLSTRMRDQAVAISLITEIDSFRVRCTLEFGTALTVSLTVTNEASSAAKYEVALHSYFAVEDAKQVEIQGLERHAFLDQLSGKPSPPSNAPVAFTSEADRIYHDTRDVITIVDRPQRRKIVLERSGSDSVVVWNPWIEKSARMSDFADDEWTKMCCVETANIAPHEIDLPPGESHTMTAIHRVEHLR